MLQRNVPGIILVTYRLRSYQPVQGVSRCLVSQLVDPVMRALLINHVKVNLPAEEVLVGPIIQDAGYAARSNHALYLPQPRLHAHSNVYRPSASDW